MQYRQGLDVALNALRYLSLGGDNHTPRAKQVRPIITQRVNAAQGELKHLNLNADKAYSF
jgi:hypothetical protein